MGDLLDSLTWKVSGITACLLAVALGVSLGIATVQKNDLTAQVRTLQEHAELRAADLTVCRSNQVLVAAAMARSNEEVQRIANEGAARIATARANVDAARRETAIVQRRLDRLLATPIAGATPCERMNDADRRVLEILK